MSHAKRSAGSHLVSVAATVVCVVVAGLLLLNRQYVIDQLAVWQYQPSDDVVQLADRSGMNRTGKFYFYASQPAVENAQDFNKNCARQETSTAILGCYNGRNIFIYNVTDARIDGIREVTAAHEMLHATYDRLSADEKQKVDALLEAEYATLKNDKDFADRMAFYARTEPGERDNELHSVIGTEVGSISKELEAHYKKYFSDRSKVVALHDTYAKVFNDLQSKSDQLSAQLTALGNKIENETLAYNKDVTQLNADITAFNAKAKGGGFTSQSEFQAEREMLVARATRLDQTRQSINGEVAQYEALRQQLESIASQSEALNKSIDSSLAPAPSL